MWSECVWGLSSAQKPLGLAALALRDEVQRMSTEAPTGHTAELNLKLLLSDLSAQNTHLVELLCGRPVGRAMRGRSHPSCHRDSVPAWPGNLVLGLRHMCTAACVVTDLHTCRHGEWEWV